MNIRELDLNLLLAFDALLTERNVTAAAKRLGLTQPATSNALSRLRRVLDDPLLVRGRHGMLPTPRALELHGPVHAALRGIERALAGEPEFDAARASRSFTIAASDYANLVLLVPLLRRLPEVAPGVDLRVVPLPAALPVAEMEGGAIDLTIGFFQRVPGGLYRQKLFEDRFVCVAPAGHSAVRGRLTVRELASLDHLQVAPRGEETGLLDTALAKRGQKRRVALRIPHFLLAPLLVAGTDLVSTLPERVARSFSALVPLALLDLPVALPRVTVAQFWHQRVHRDPAHVWLRSMLVDVAAAPA